MSEDTNGSFWSSSQKVRRREEDPPDNRGGSEQTEPMGSKPFSFRDAVMNSNPLNNPLNNKWEDDNIDLMNGRKIGYNSLCNKVCSLWKPSMRFQLMDIENDYFLAKSESFVDYSNVLLNGLWIIVQEKYFQVIGEMVGNIIKIDLMTDKGAKGQFAGFAVQIDLRKHLKGDYPQPKIMENMEKRLGEAEDPIRLDQHENRGSIQERIENEKFGEWIMKNQGGGIEKIGMSSETLKIGPNVGSGLSKFGTNGVVHRGESDATLIDDSSDDGLKADRVIKSIGLPYSNAKLVVLDQDDREQILGRPSGVVH
ncbi:hypothetical protein Goklo_007916 [Gossypium klotzschianum]|uniref:DUF4283 domain-containing protein n=1 Tax=Gossypium klotzschianum TaxID=34286 RepID=A0A7J8UY19_9ROSI|nr:hypothetical protein [Gossypium klotzschianum]